MQPLTFELETNGFRRSISIDEAGTLRTASLGYRGIELLQEGGYEFAFAGYMKESMRFFQCEHFRCVAHETTKFAEGERWIFRLELKPSEEQVFKPFGPEPWDESRGNLHVELVFDVYRDYPVIRKRIRVRNQFPDPLRLQYMTWEDLRLASGEGRSVCHQYFTRNSLEAADNMDESAMGVVWPELDAGILVATALVASLVEGLRLVDILPLSLVLLMSAVPVALPVMFTVSMAVGSMELARHGVLVTRLSAAEDAANMDVVCADKTGTLTMNRLSFMGALPQPGFTVEDVVRVGALASQESDQDPIDLAFLRAAREHKLVDSGTALISFTPFSPKTRRTEALVERGGVKTRVMKGALRTVAEAAGLDGAAIAALEAKATEEAKQGVRVLAVARSNGEAPMQFVGLALLYDAPRPDSRQLIDELHSLGVAVKMLTGDALPVARAVASELGLGEIVRAPELHAAGDAAAAGTAELVQSSSGFAEVFPEDKFLVVKSLQAAGHIVGMNGDGVNDAPALRQAEVGIAVSGATDVAKGAASVVLTTEGLRGIVDLVTNGRAIYQRVLTWIVNKVSRTILKSGFVVIAFLATGKFAISALGMVLIVFMTDFVKIALSTDRVRPSPKPETWNIGPLVRLAVLLGIAMLIEALVLLAIGWREFDLGSHPGQLQTFTFQTLLYFALFSLVSIRERRAFWASRPSTILAAALLADASLGILIGAFGLVELKPLPLTHTILIIGFALVSCLGLNDLIKCAFLRRLR